MHPCCVLVCGGYNCYECAPFQHTCLSHEITGVRAACPKYESNGEAGQEDQEQDTRVRGFGCAVGRWMSVISECGHAATLRALELWQVTHLFFAAADFNGTRLKKIAPNHTDSAHEQRVPRRYR